MTRLVLIRHAEPLVVKKTTVDRPLSTKGRNDARVLGTRLAGRLLHPIVLAGPERRAYETGRLAFPLMEIDVRDQLKEVKKPWYASIDDHEHALAEYLGGRVVQGWEPREDVVARIAQLKLDLGSPGSVVLVGHGVLFSTWLDHELGLDDPVAFWSGLRMPDAWELDLEKRSLRRIL